MTITSGAARAVSLLLWASILAGSAAAAKTPVDPCWQAAEVDAWRLRALQAQLMVATLKCSASGVATVTTSYNRFISASQLTLRDAATVLLARFKRLKERDAMGTMDKLTTNLANTFSTAAMGPNACAQAGDVAEMAARANAADLAVLAQALVPAMMDGIACPAVVKQ
jgi:hypothetical protein